MALYNNTSLANNVNSQPINDYSDLIGAGAGAGVGLLGTYGATTALTGAEQNAIGTQQGAYGTSQGIYSNQAGLGNASDTALGSQLGLYGTPNYSAFNNSPGYQFAQSQGDLGIDRTAASNGSLYTPNTLAMLSQYNTGYASQNYNNYIGQLMQSAGLGNSANQGLNSANLQTSGNISQLQQNQGVANSSGIAGATGIVSNLLGRSGGLINNMTGGNVASQNASGLQNYDNGLLSGASDQIGNEAAGWQPSNTGIYDTSSINWGDDSGG